MSKEPLKDNYATFWATISTIQETGELLGRFTRELDTGALSTEEARLAYDVESLDKLLFKGLKSTAKALDMLNHASPGTAAQRLADSGYWRVSVDDVERDNS